MRLTFQHFLVILIKMNKRNQENIIFDPQINTTHNNWKLGTYVIDHCLKDIFMKKEMVELLLLSQR